MVKKISVFMENICIEISIEVTKFLRESHVVEAFLYYGWGCEMFNIGRATQWAFADGLGVNSKADPETVGLAILILRQVARLFNQLIANH